MLIKRIIEYLIDNGIQDYVLDGEFIELSRDIRAKGADAVLVSDIRSATFYACGLAEKKNSQVVLIVRNEYLSNTFTGLMESWFQKRQLIVIAIGAEVLNCSLECYKSCTCGQFKIQYLSEFETCYNDSKQDGPKIFLVEAKLPCSNPIYNIDIISLEKQIPEECKLFVYAPVACNRSERKNTFYIDSKFKYGIISKFLGRCIFEKKKCVLLTDVSAFNFEMNVFNSRYIDQRFNLILAGERPLSNTIKWLQSNSINTVVCESIEAAIDAIFKTSMPTVAFVLTQEVDTGCTQI